MYALTTHTTEVSVNPRSERIDGNATFTMVVSSTIISSPMHSSVSAHQRLSACTPVIGQVGSTWIIQPTPYLSWSMPKQGEKKVLVSGICTWPPAPSLSNSDLASASFFGLSESEKPWNALVPPVQSSAPM